MTRYFLLTEKGAAERFLFGIEWKYRTESNIELGHLGVTLYRVSRDGIPLRYDGFTTDITSGNNLVDDQSENWLALHIADLRVPALDSGLNGAVRPDGRGRGLGTTLMHLIYKCMPPAIDGRLIMHGKLVRGDARERRDRFWSRSLGDINGIPSVRTDSRGEGRVVGVLRDPCLAGTSARLWNTKELPGLAVPELSELPTTCPSDVRKEKSLQEIPTVNHERLYHVGYLSGSPSATYSLEGHGLSVSLVPDAWRRIARLGGAPCHMLEKRGAQFLDAIAFKENDDAMQSMIAWACEKRLIIPALLYRVEWFDDDLDSEVYMLLQSRDEARTEADGHGVKAKPQRGYMPTESLLQLTGYKEAEPAMALELALLIYTERELGLDGVYWDEKLDPVIYSAPRGCIFPSVLNTWTITRTEERALEADEPVLATSDSVAP